MHPVTLIVISLFTGLGLWWGWRSTAVALHIGTAPRWRRPEGVSRDVHGRRVRRRQLMWRLRTVAMWACIGAVAGYAVLTIAPSFR